VHAEENLVAVETHGGIEGRKVRYPRSGVEHDENEVLDLLAGPFAAAGSRNDGAPDLVAGGDNAVNFVVGKRGFAGRDGVPLGRRDVGGQICLEPLPPEAEFGLQRDRRDGTFDFSGTTSAGQTGRAL